MESRPGGTNLVEPRGQGALPSGIPIQQPWWTTSAGVGAVSPAVVAPGSGAGISLSGRDGGGDDAAEESSDDSRRSGETKGIVPFPFWSGCRCSARFYLCNSCLFWEQIVLELKKETNSDVPN